MKPVASAARLAGGLSAAAQAPHCRRLEQRLPHLQLRRAAALPACSLALLATARRLATSRSAQSGRGHVAQRSTAGSYVDVHCHLFHESFKGADGEDEAVQRARDASLKHVVVNGLDPETNRAVEALCARHPDVLRSALGIYPSYASANAIDGAEFQERLGFEAPTPFDVAAEISKIDAAAAAGSIIAVGEAGLDGMYGYNEKLLAAQEEVLRELCKVAKKHCLPIIVHSRCAEKRVFEVLQDEGVEKADFHCYMGKKKLGMQIADAGYYLSIPSVVTRHPQIQGLCRALPMDRLLTETDSPFLAPEKGQFPNEPSTVPSGVAAMAKVRGEAVEEVRCRVMENYERLFQGP